MARVAVFGLGNVLLADDALGPWVVQQLHAGWDFPEGVHVDDLGTPGLELSTHLAGNEHVILVDAVAGNDPPGTVHVYDRDAILKHPTGIRLGPHDPSLAETVRTMELVDDGPRDVVLVGVVPTSTAPELGLSRAVRSSVPQVAERIVGLLKALGCAVVRRADSKPVSVWWESDVAVPAFADVENTLAS